MAGDLKNRIQESLAEFTDLRQSMRIEEKLQDLRKHETEMEKPDFWNDSNRAQGIIQKVKGLKAQTQAFVKLDAGLEDLATLAELADEEKSADTWAEVEESHGTLAADLVRLKVQAFFSGPNDHRDAILQVHAGAGGVDACDWASMLYRMYQRYCDRMGFSLRELSSQPEEEAGYRTIDCLVKGLNAYGYLRSEIGVHRLVRISPFDANSRRHTAFASVDILPDFGNDEINIEIADGDLRVDTFSAGGPGGQHVNKTQSAVRIVHIPSGILVSCQNERSQHANRRQAMAILKSKLFRLEEQKRDEELRKLYGEKGEIAWGHQIRSYTLQPFTLVKDHRTNVDTSSVEAVLDGNIETFVEAYLKHKAKES